MMQVPGLVTHTPLQNYLHKYGLLVKREDLCAPAPWPPFSKTRGVLSYMEARVAEGHRLFGVLDTFHSQGGQAVSAAGARLGVKVIDYYPEYKGKPGWRAPQDRCLELGAELVGLPAGRSAVLYHQAKRDCEARGGHMFPNALKLDESIEETAREVARTVEQATDHHWFIMRHVPWLVPASSATLAAGVYEGMRRVYGAGLGRMGASDVPRLIIHMGYSRSRDAVINYMSKKLQWTDKSAGDVIMHVDEDYEYKDHSRPHPEADALPWPANEYYDRKTVRWWLMRGRALFGRAVLWNIG